MMTHNNATRLDLIAQLADAHGLSPNELARHINNLTPSSTPRTLREAVEDLLAEDRLPSWVSTNVGLRRLLDGQAVAPAGNVLVTGFPGLGDLPLHLVTTAALRKVQADVRRFTGEVVVAQHLAKGRRTRSYDPADYGQGAENTFVQVTKRTASELIAVGDLIENPASGLGTASRGLHSPPPALERRGLDNDEISKVLDLVRARVADPLLFALFIQLGLQTGARREGLLNLTLSGIDVVNCTVTTNQKYSKVHARPVQRRLLRMIYQLAVARGAVLDSDHVFRRRDGNVLTRRQLDGVFAKVQQSGILPVHLPVSSHWLRHTALTWIEETSGVLVARAWAGHSDKRLGTIGTYLPKEVAPKRLRAAAEATFGPLEDEDLGVPLGSTEGKSVERRLLRSESLWQSPYLALPSPSEARHDASGATLPKQKSKASTRPSGRSATKDGSRPKKRRSSGKKARGKSRKGQQR